MPVRIQRKRTRGWRMPQGAVYVARPTWFGNPFTPDKYWDAGYSGSEVVAISACVKAYREWLTGARFTHDWRYPDHFLAWLEACRPGRVERLPELRGKDLACWCPLLNPDGTPHPCHAQILIELANPEPRP